MEKMVKQKNWLNGNNRNRKMVKWKSWLNGKIC